MSLEAEVCTQCGGSGRTWVTCEGRLVSKACALCPAALQKAQRDLFEHRKEKLDPWVERYRKHHNKVF